MPCPEPRGEAMRRRSKAGGQQVKKQHRKTMALKRRNAPKAKQARSPSASGWETKITQLTREHDEALEQQSATAEVLRIISASRTELQPVLEVVVRSAARYCKADDVTLFELDGQDLREAAHWGALQHGGESFRFPCTRGSVAGRVVLERKPVHIADLQAEAENFPEGSAMARRFGHRTIASVPLLREGVAVGTLQLRRTEVNPFTDKQIALLEIFASQAVIAIENARLLNELRDSLQQQTATSDVLKVISRSTFNLQAVLDTLVESSARLCQADSAAIHRPKGDFYPSVASYGYTRVFEEYMREHPVAPTSGTVLGRAIIEHKTIHVHDVESDPDYVLVERQKVGGYHTVLGVPLLREGMPIGVLILTRTTVRPFTDKQIELVETFADQAVIAIENARLLNELQQRTADLGESLEQQTATADVLRVISSSPGDLAPVFHAMLENAVRICEAKFGFLQLSESGGFRIGAMHNVPTSMAQAIAERGGPILHPGPLHPLARVAATKQLLQVSDYREEVAYKRREPAAVRLVEIAGARTVLYVPMLKEDDLVGIIVIYRQEVRPFTEKQIELVTNFAAQAVIAIENTRLLSELRESLQRQTAMSEVLSVISSSPGELKPVFEAMLENAVRICEAKFGALYRFDGKAFHSTAEVSLPPEFAEFQRQRGPFQPPPGTLLDRVMRTKQVSHTADAATDPDTVSSAPARLGGARSMVTVPMLKDKELIGAINIFRQEVRPFTDKQIALVQNFAAQAVIAIENTRLLNELRQSLQQQTATADVLKVISRSTFDLQVVLNTLVESAAHLCDADMAFISRREGEGYRFGANFGYSPEYAKFLETQTLSPGRGTMTGRAVYERRAVQIADVTVDPEYAMPETYKLGRARTILSVPLLRENEPIGTINLARRRVEAFTEKQIGLATTFADQAGIAIENVRLFDEIQDKSRQLEEASQHKSQFLANMSHELRTPLNAILGYTELMTDGAYGEPSEKMLGILKRLEANGKHLLGLINDVLDLSKIEAGQLVLELSDYCIQDIAQTVRSTLEPLAADKKLGFKVEVAPQLPPGHGDGRRLTQVLINLVGNAIKFTDTGEIAIKAEANNGAFYVSVQDTGPGISAADQARLFQEFQQADNAITKKKGGTGLGLAISKRIIEMHGGRIWVESQPGQGSTFTFTLPVIVERQIEAV
jgi:GAF domain-containing protein